MEGKKITEAEGKEFCEIWENYMTTAKLSNTPDDQMKNEFIGKLKEKFGDTVARDIVRLVVSNIYLYILFDCYK